MSLTDDEKKEVLEPCGRGYSHRRIADRTGHSETTIRNVINEACTEVVKLKDEDLQAEQIASQLDYPLAFVSRILRKYEEKEEKKKEKIKAEIEAEVEPEVEAEANIEAEIGANELSHRPSVENDWQEFEGRQELSDGKELQQEKADNLINKLEQLEKEVQNAGVADQNWLRRKKSLEDALKVFVTQQIDKIGCVEELAALESVIIGIEEKIRNLSEMYRPKITEAVKARRREKTIKLREAEEESNWLIDQSTKNVPLFPEFVRTKIKRLITVRNNEETLILVNAMRHYGQHLIQTNQKDPEHIKQYWQIFVEAVQQRRWDYLREMDQQYWSDAEKALLEIEVCAHCGEKLNTERKRDLGILRCIPCGKSYRLPS